MAKSKKIQTPAAPPPPRHEDPVEAAIMEEADRVNTARRLAEALFANQRNFNQNVVAQWGKKLVDHPEKALEAVRWADDLFDHAARAYIATEVLRGLAAGRAIAQLREVCASKAFDWTRFPSRSSSSASNRAAQAEAAAWAEAAENLKGLV